AYEDGTCPDNLCSDDIQCPSGYACHMGTCVATACRDSSDCAGTDTPICRQFSNPANNVCAIQCKTPTTWDGNCPCNTDSDCLDENGSPLTGNAKFCDFYNKRCCACRLDSDCLSGYCNGCSCVNQPVCTVGTVTESKCKSCQEPGNEFEWKGTACCPTASNTLNPFKSLTGDYCRNCGGFVNETGECEVLSCEGDISTYTSSTLCLQCGGKWNRSTSTCTKGNCRTNADCNKNQYCGGSYASCTYATYNTCMEASYTIFRITHNGLNETWYMFNNKMNWWDARNACQSIGKELQPLGDVLDRWKEIGAKGYQDWVWTATATDAASCYAFTVALSVGYVCGSCVGRDAHGLALCH
ncbi:MAG: hypothetical protein ACI4QM_00450, partial [Alphaproteobacteria bacterium]